MSNIVCATQLPICRATAMVDENDTRSSWSPVPAGFTQEGSTIQPLKQLINQ